MTAGCTAWDLACDRMDGDRSELAGEDFLACGTARSRGMVGKYNTCVCVENARISTL